MNDAAESNAAMWRLLGGHGANQTCAQCDGRPVGYGVDYTVFFKNIAVEASRWVAEGKADAGSLGDLVAVASLIAYSDEAGECTCSDGGIWTTVPQPAAVSSEITLVSAYSDFPNSKSGMHWLYRLWSPDDRLIYVGVTRNLQARIDQHRRRFAGSLASVSFQPYDSYEAVLAAENAAIVNEHPAFNVAGISS